MVVILVTTDIYGIRGTLSCGRIYIELHVMLLCVISNCNVRCIRSQILTISSTNVLANWYWLIIIYHLLQYYYFPCLLTGTCRIWRWGYRLLLLVCWRSDHNESYTRQLWSLKCGSTTPISNYGPHQLSFIWLLRLPMYVEVWLHISPAAWPQGSFMTNAKCQRQCCHPWEKSRQLKTKRFKSKVSTI